MSSQLPQRLSPVDLAPGRSQTPMPTPPGPAGVQRVDARPVPAPAPEAKGRDLTASSLTVGEIRGERVNVTVNHYHGPVTNLLRQEVVQQVAWSRVDSRPAPAPERHLGSDVRASSEGGALRVLVVGLVAFTAFSSVLVLAYRALVAPAPTTVIVPTAEGPAERPMPRTFLEYVESQGQ
ncbi:hypothetical protein [Tautonia sociabilis]|uniref:Uncharacterized protein n=1 Tax=Tautonia sociabilis TaxID=2080755 RepID=A0A432MF63_9BACT|nr:hypothetical protein [Tautonia sociabilis]RUL84601.1 hypothetical protein TsocGM_20205 [Tautonia sociabilis]